MAEKVCTQFNSPINTLKKEQGLDMGEKYLWLDESDERKHMSDKEILEKYVNLDNTFLLYRSIEAFNLRDEIGTCLNIEVGIRCEGVSPYSSPVMVICQKLMQDKRVVMDFRHLNIRIAKNNLAYPLVRDTLSVLGNSKCEVLLVLDLKGAFPSLRLLEDSKKYCGISPYFRSASFIYQRMPKGLNISPSIWQSYINAILECLQSRKHCEAIMDDLLLFTPSKKAHVAKLEDLLKALLKWT